MIRYLITILLMMTTLPAMAQDDRALNVAFLDAPPYARQTPDGAWTGMAPTLWRLLAEREGVAYRIVPLTAQEMPAALADGRVDIALPVFADAALARDTALTLPFYTATLGLAAPRRSQIVQVLRGLVSRDFLRLVAWLSALLLAVGAIVWALERRGNEEQFHRGAFKGLGDGFWWAGVTLTTIGYGDKAPLTLPGRTVAMMWMLAGLPVSATVTATIVTLAGTDTVDLQDQIADRRVGVIDGRNAATFLDGRSVDLVRLADMQALLAALDTGEIDIAAEDNLLLHDALDRRTETVSIEETRLDPVLVGMATRPELRDAMNVALLRALSDASGWDIVSRYGTP